MNIAIVGAGAVGTTAAAYLAEDGHEVWLYEADRLAAGASGRAAGLTYDAYADSLGMELASISQQSFRDADGDSPFWFTDCPYIWFATESGDIATAIRRGVRGMQDRGVDASIVDPESLEAEFPGLAMGDVEVIAIARNAGYADPECFVRRQAERAITAGAKLRENTPVEVRSDPPRVDHEDGTEQFDAIGVAAGARTRELLAEAGHPIAVAPYRVQALITDGHGRAVPMLFDATAEIYARPHEAGLLVGDGTEETAVDPDIWAEDADDWFLENMMRYLPSRISSPGSLKRAWAGLCTATPDGEPLVGTVTPGLSIATGWHGHGFMWAPATGRLLAKSLTTTPTPEPRFDPLRFRGDEEINIVQGMSIE